MEVHFSESHFNGPKSFTQAFWQKICLKMCLVNAMLQSANLTPGCTKSHTGPGQKLPAWYPISVVRRFRGRVGVQCNSPAPHPSSQQSAILGVLEPEVVSLCLISLDGFFCSCLLLFLACIYVKEQQQRAVTVSHYTSASRNRKYPSTSKVRRFPDSSISSSHYNSSV